LPDATRAAGGAYDGLFIVLISHQQP
jgi:hypothetical protein